MALRHLTFATAVLQYVSAQAQQSRIVPQDLQAGFRGGAVEMQVSYENRAVDGFRDGTQFEQNAVSQEPTFALGDSSGISPTLLFTILMVDTTCAGKRTLHYARANFKNNFDITNIKTDAAALQAYKAPGSFGETGDNRQYSFLMYTNPNRQPITNLKLPAEGAVFDVKQFQTDNNLPDPQAGVGMIVKLGGQVDCGGDQANTLPANLPSVRPSTTAARTTATNAAPTLNTGPGSSATSAAGATPSSNAGASSASGASSTTAAQKLLTPSSSSAARNPGNDNSNAPVSSERRPSGSTAAPNPAQSSGAAEQSAAKEPTGAATTLVPSGRPAGSPTASSSIVQQTANAAPGHLLEHLGLLASLMAVVGLVL